MTNVQAAGGARVRAAAIRIENVTKSYGAVTAVNEVSFDVGAGETLAIIGPNGAGKTTLLKAIAGVVPLTSGAIYLDGERIERVGAARASHAGVGFAHQVPQPFRGLSVRDNVRVGAVEHRIHDLEAWTDHVMETCGLTRHARRLAESLQILDLKRLELARALATQPTLLLLDEVCAGLVGRELDEVIGLVSRLKAEGPTVVLVEHIEAVVSQLADRVVVLDWGVLVANGTPAEVAADEAVREVYLGTSQAQGVRAPREVAEGSTGTLEVRDVRAGYGGLEALHGVSLEIQRGRICAILGANGAGKTTLSAVISGTVPARSGLVMVDGVDVTTLPAHRRTAAGIAICPEGRKIFGELTVRENLLLPVRLRAGRAEIERRLAAVLEIFPQLAKLSDRKGRALSGGQQQMVAIGRALMSEPKYLICDEVSLGLAPIAVDSLYEGLVKIADQGVGLALIEQHVHRSLAIADIAYVMDRGVVAYAGPPQPLNDPVQLNAVYFGTSAT